MNNHKAKRDQFDKVRGDLTRTLAEAAEAKLKSMGDDVKSLSWFSSSAEKRAKKK